MIEELFSLLFYCETDIKQYAGQKTLADVSGQVCHYLSSVALETFYCHTIWERLFMFLWKYNIFLVKQLF